MARNDLGCTGTRGYLPNSHSFTRAGKNTPKQTAVKSTLIHQLIEGYLMYKIWCNHLVC
ncbi:conserved protein of unknown function [Limnospira indica PCC 8005]|uniref:Uncharacterized protein n=1 Tax=Limnospira indica PCC 8005 TaxID=376219 RepID=A0A9P1KIU8_9CYAN|nr:conserved protein of unknown function [Limnospira indica PCC 8005]